VKDMKAIPMIKLNQFIAITLFMPMLAMAEQSISIGNVEISYKLSGEKVIAYPVKTSVVMQPSAGPGIKTCADQLSIVSDLVTKAEAYCQGVNHNTFMCGYYKDQILQSLASKGSFTEAPYGKYEIYFPELDANFVDSAKSELSRLHPDQEIEIVLPQDRKEDFLFRNIKLRNEELLSKLQMFLSYKPGKLVFTGNTLAIEDSVLNCEFRTGNAEVMFEMNAVVRSETQPNKQHWRNLWSIYQELIKMKPSQYDQMPKHLRPMVFGVLLERAYHQTNQVLQLDEASSAATYFFDVGNWTVKNYSSSYSFIADNYKPRIFLSELEMRFSGIVLK
jgi:hypothetical protein